MHKVLVTAAVGAALTFSAAAASADHAIGMGANTGAPQSHRFDHRSGRGGQDGVAIWGGYDLRSSYDDSGWSGQSGNDWWNDRPDRAYPRWVQEQRARGSCDPDRMWWSGSGWHC